MIVITIILSSPNNKNLEFKLNTRRSNHGDQRNLFLEILYKHVTDAQSLLHIFCFNTRR